MALLYAYTGWVQNMTIAHKQVEEILQEVESGKTLAEISYTLKIPYNDLWEACYGKTGKRIRKNNDEAVVELVKQGYSTPYIANKLGISTTAVSKIYRRVSGESISDYRKKRSVRYGSK